MGYPRLTHAAYPGERVAESEKAHPCVQKMSAFRSQHPYDSAFGGQDNQQDT